MLWVILLTSIKFFPDAIQGQTIISSPVHFMGTLDGSANFTCQVEFIGVQRFFSWEFNKNPIYIHQYDVEAYPLGEKKYSVKKEIGTFTLTVKDLVYEDGGLYSCLVLGQARAAVLLVLGTPHLSISPPNPLEGSVTQFICTAKIGGPKKEDILPEQYPQLQIFFEGESLNGAVKEQDLQGSMNIFNLTMIYNTTLALHMDGKELTCEIKSLNPAVHINVTTNVTVLRPTEIPSEDSGNESWKIAVAFAIPMLLIITIAGVAAFYYRASLRKSIYRQVPSEEVNVEEEMELNNFEDQGDSFVVKETIDPDNETDHNVVIVLDKVVLKIPSKSVAESTYVSVRGKESSQARQLQIKSFGLDKILKPVLQLSLESPISKLLKPAQIEVTCKEVNEDSKVLVFSRLHKEDQWTDTTDECGVETKEDVILFKTDTFTEFEIFLSSSNKEDTSSLACKILNNQKTRSSVKGEEETSTITEKKTDKKRKSKYERLVMIIDGLQCWNDLDKANAQKIKQLINHQNGPSVLIRILEKVEILIKSDHFVGVCKAAALRCTKTQAKIQEDPLLVLVEKLEKDGTSPLTQYPQKFLELIEILQQFDGSNDTRSRCVRALITNTKEWRLSHEEMEAEKDNSNSIKQLQWNSDLLKVLKGLGEMGADPAWSPEGSNKGSNLHLFMVALKFVISHKSDLTENLMDLLEDMMTDSSLDCNSVDGERKTILHTVVEGKSRPLLPNIAEQLLQIISRIKAKNYTLLDSKNHLNHTPLHTFVTSVLLSNEPETDNHLFTEAAKQWRDDKEACLQIVECLISPTNRDMECNGGKTPLHYITECANEWKDYPQAFLDVVKCLRSDTNIDANKIKGRTPLYEFVNSTKNWKRHPETILEVIKCLVSDHNIDLQTKGKFTPLCQFTTGAAEWVDKPDPFMEVVNHLKSEKNIDFQDKNGCTPLNHVTCAAAKWANYPGIFLKLIECLKSPSNINLQSHSRYTPLASFTNAAPEWANHADKFLEVVEYLASGVNIDMQNQNLSPPLFTFTSAAKQWASFPNVFFKVVKRLKSNSNVNFQTQSGYTSLHHITFVARDWKDHADIFLEVIECLQSSSNIDVQNDEGFTPLHNFVAGAYFWVGKADTFLKVVQCLRSPSNVKLQDKKSQTALQIFKDYSKNWSTQSKISSKVENCLKSSETMPKTGILNQISQKFDQVKRFPKN